VSRLGVLFALAAASSCRVDLTDPIDASRPEMVVGVALSDSAAIPVVRINGSLWPGIGSDGRPRSVADPSIRLAGFAVAPRTTNAVGALMYDTTAALDPASFAGLLLDLQAPALPGVVSPPSHQMILPWRAGPGAVTAVRGEDVALTVMTPGDTLNVVPGFWSLAVSGAAFHLSVNSFGPLTSPLVIPAAWLAGAALGDLDVQLRVAQVSFQDNGYRTGIQSSVVLRWVVTLIEP
jgi:hypothetical protein